MTPRVAGRPSALLDTRVVYCGDCLEQLKKLPINPETYLLDEAFKTIYAGEKVNFKQMKKQDLPSLAKMLGENVNKRLGLPIVQDVLIDQLAYIPQKDVRGPPNL